MDDLRSNPAFENATIRTSSVAGPSSLPECLTSTECGSNFNCVDGKCVQMDTKGDITAASSGGTACGTTTTITPVGTVSSTTPGASFGGSGGSNGDCNTGLDGTPKNCSQGGTCGSSKGGWTLSTGVIFPPCCGGKYWRCAPAYAAQCSPCSDDDTGFDEDDIPDCNGNRVYYCTDDTGRGYLSCRPCKADDDDKTDDEVDDEEDKCAPGQRLRICKGRLTCYECDDPEDPDSDDDDDDDDDKPDVDPDDLDDERDRCEQLGKSFNICDGKPQCGPCDDWDVEPACTSFCDSYFKSNGVAASGCSGKNCSDCQECSSEVCVNDDSGPCWCKPGNDGCPFCKKCVRGGDDSGDCIKAKGVCTDNCNCFVKCPNGKIIEGSHSQDYLQSGPSCAMNCRDKLRKQCPPEEPAVDPCTASGDPCLKPCKCVTRYTSCTGSQPSCPSGYRCKLLGTWFQTDGEGNCTSSNLSGNSNYQASKAWHIRQCKVVKSKECKNCDCNCENDCPDCYKCGSNGVCQYDEACDEPCNEPCSGNCCSEGQVCVPAILWEVVDSCHDDSVTIAVPAGVELTLQHIENIEADEAICNRFHTHCNVMGSNGHRYAVHLDCQKGLRRIGPAGYSTCRSL